MKLILFLVFWSMMGFMISHFLGFWGVFCLILFIVFFNLVTYDKQIQEVKKKKK